MRAAAVTKPSPLEQATNLAFAVVHSAAQTLTDEEFRAFAATVAARLGIVGARVELDAWGADQ